MGFIKKLFWTILILFIAIAWFIDNPITIDASSNSTPPVSAEEKAEKIRMASVSVVGKMVQSQLKNPNSVEWTKILSSEDGELLCFIYRAENSFGALAIEKTATSNGQIVDWNKNCANKSLNDMTYAKRGI